MDGMSQARLAYATRDHTVTPKPEHSKRGFISQQSISAAGSFAGNVATSVFARSVDWLFPPQCANCRTSIERANALCGTCWAKLRTIGHPLCPVLGVPFDYDLGPDAKSAEAIAAPPDFDWARAAVVYDEVAQRLVSRLKYSDHQELAQFMGQMIVRAVPDVLNAEHVLVPVPLHPRRQWLRRYNQSSLLAHEIAKLHKNQIAQKLVRRTKNTHQQVGLNARQRDENVRGAFVVNEDIFHQFTGKSLILVDDVVTTGSTVNAIARQLRDAGASQVGVLSFARVVAGADQTI